LLCFPDQNSRREWVLLKPKYKTWSRLCISDCAYNQYTRSFMTQERCRWQLVAR
jgi:hypothetical protein